MKKVEATREQEELATSTESKPFKSDAKTIIHKETENPEGTPRIYFMDQRSSSRERSTPSH